MSAISPPLASVTTHNPPNTIICKVNSDSELGLKKARLSEQIVILNILRNELICSAVKYPKIPVFVHMFRHMTVKQFMDSTTDVLDRLIEKFVSKNERGNLYKLAYSLFGGRKGNLAYGLKIRLSNQELGVAIQAAYKEMRQLFKNEFADCLKIHTWQLKQLGEIEHFRADLRRERELERVCERLPAAVCSVFRTWCRVQESERKHRMPFQEGDAVIPISHGGGYLHLMDFLHGKSKGYKLQSNGYGIQVSPQLSNLAGSYAQRASAAHFDQACILTAKIAGKYLDKDPNTYVAGLRAQYVPYLQDIRIELLSGEIIF